MRARVLVRTRVRDIALRVLQDLDEEITAGRKRIRSVRDHIEDIDKKILEISDPGYSQETCAAAEDDDGEVMEVDLDEAAERPKAPTVLL